MNLPKVHSKIFWPTHSRQAPSGYVVGWNIRSFVVCVVTVVDGIEYAELEHILNKFAQSNNITNNIINSTNNIITNNNNSIQNSNNNSNFRNYYSTNAIHNNSNTNHNTISTIHPPINPITATTTTLGPISPSIPTSTPTSTPAFTPSLTPTLTPSLTPSLAPSLTPSLAPTNPTPSTSRSLPHAKLARELSPSHFQLGPPKILGIWINNQSSTSSASSSSSSSFASSSSSSSSPANPSHLSHTPQSIDAAHLHGKAATPPWPLAVPDVHDVDIWISLEQDRFLAPQVREICCYGYRYQNGSRWTSSQIIFYTPPVDHFYSMHQLTFDANAKPCDCSVPATELEATLRQINCSRDIERNLLSMIEANRISHRSSPSSGITSEPANGQMEATGLRRRHLPREGNKEKHPQTLSDDDDDDDDDEVVHSSWFLRALEYISKASRILLLVVLFLKIVLYGLEKIGLQQRTFTGCQLSRRLAVLQENPSMSLPDRQLKQPSTAPSSTSPLVKKSNQTTTQPTVPSPIAHTTSTSATPSDTVPPSNRPHKTTQSHYKMCTWPNQLRMWNARWLAVNDIIMGIIAGYFLYRYSTAVLHFLEAQQLEITDSVLRKLIEWLMGWPAGFKLNENLDRFLGRLFLYYIDKWSIVTRVLFFHVGTTVIHVVSLCGMLGISVMISLILDLTAFFTMHITCFYYISARFHYLELVVLSSLWKLFRGKKYNPLKHRIDSCDYEFDQLLLGTILLTLLVFLFPTTAVYYLFFTSLRLILICFQGLSSMALELLNHFPLYHLVIYFTHPELLPSGIRFAVEFTKPPNNNNKNNKNTSNTNNNRANDEEPNNRTNKTSYGRLTNDDQHITNQFIALDRGPLRSSSDSLPFFAAKKNKTAATIPPDTQGTGTEAETHATTYLRLESQPVLMSSLFFHQHQFISDVLKTYTFPKLVQSFLTGAPWPVS